MGTIEKWQARQHYDNQWKHFYSFTLKVDGLMGWWVRGGKSYLPLLVDSWPRKWWTHFARKRLGWRPDRNSGRNVVILGATCILGPNSLADLRSRMGVGFMIGLVTMNNLRQDCFTHKWANSPIWIHPPPLDLRSTLKKTFKHMLHYIIFFMNDTHIESR